MKPIRKAVRCFVIQQDKVLVIQYKEGNRKQGYYDIPGGKIEQSETAEETVSRMDRNREVIRKEKYFIQYFIIKTVL